MKHVVSLLTAAGRLDLAIVTVNFLFRVLPGTVLNEVISEEDDATLNSNQVGNVFMRIVGESFGSPSSAEEEIQLQAIQALLRVGMGCLDAVIPIAASLEQHLLYSRSRKIQEACYLTMWLLQKAHLASLDNILKERPDDDKEEINNNCCRYADVFRNLPLSLTGQTSDEPLTTWWTHRTQRLGVIVLCQMILLHFDSVSEEQSTLLGNWYSLSEVLRHLMVIYAQGSISTSNDRQEYAVG